MLRLCRACLGEVEDLSFVSIADINETSQIRTKLSECIPEMVIDRVLNPVLCTLCVISLQSAYDFKTRCLITEQRIQNYIKTVDSKSITLEEIYSERENNLPNFNNDLANTATELADDLNNLLDGVIQNQLKVLDRKNENNENQKDEGIDNLGSTNEYSSDDDLDMGSNFSEEEENVGLNLMPIKKCFVKLQKLPDELFKPSTSKYGDEKNFKCSECDFSTAKKKNLKKHEARIHKCEKRFACEVCDDRFRVKRHFAKHMKIHQLPYKCNLCNYQSNRKDHFTSHTFTHELMPEKTVCCKLCDYKTANVRALHSHMKNHREKKFTCNICGSAFHFKSLMAEHIAMHTGEKPYACTLCSFRTSYNSNLRAHIKFVHTDRSFTCDICKQSVASKKYLAEHMLIHTGEKPFACKVCKFKTASKTRLQEHVRIHTGEKPFSCKLCKFSFAYRTNLRRHMHVHEKQRDNLVCNICEYQCKSEFILKAHLKAHEAKNVISCPTCKYITTSRTTFDIHLKTHIKEEDS